PKVCAISVICASSGSCTPSQTKPSRRVRTSAMASSWVKCPGSRTPSTYTAQSTIARAVGTGMRGNGVGVFAEPRKYGSGGIEGTGRCYVRGASRTAHRPDMGTARRPRTDTLEGVRIDLHTHSTASDGTDTPAELVRTAAAAGLDVGAITDHDTTAGWAEAVAARPDGLTLIR